MSGEITLSRLRGDIAAILEVDPSEVGDDDNLMDIGLDSIRAMNLVLEWEQNGVPVSFPDLVEAMTLGGIWSIVSPRL